MSEGLNTEGWHLISDLISRNILIVSEGRGGSARKFLARHRAFSELSAEQSSPTEALVDLLALLKQRVSGWSQDAWHNLELDRAAFSMSRPSSRFWFRRVN